MGEKHEKKKTNPQLNFEKSKTVTIAQAAKMLGDDILPKDVHKRILLGTLEADKTEDGWRVSVADLKRILSEEVEPCTNCGEDATKFVIVKYLFHHHVRFALCQKCAEKAHSAYSQKGGVVEVITFPLLGRGWMGMDFYGLSPKE